MVVLFVHRKPSFWLAALLSLVHIVAAILLWPLALPLGIKAIVVIALVISLIYYLRKDALLIANNAVMAFTISDEMRCTVTVRSGESIVCSISSNTFVAPYLTVLNLKPIGGFLTCSVVILSDGIDAEEFRQLRVWLRWKSRDIG